VTRLVAMLAEAVRISLRGMRANKLRTLLTALGNVVAVGALVTVVALVEGVNQDVSRAILARGADVFYVERFGPITSDAEWQEAMRRPPVRPDDARAIREGTRLAGHVLATFGRSASVEALRAAADSVRVEARTADYPHFLEEDLAEGRHFTGAEDRLRAPVVVLGAEVAEALFPGGSALGRSVRVAGAPLTVIGVVKPKGALLGQSQDRYAVVPFEVGCSLFGAPWTVRVAVKPRAPELLDACADEARVVLRAHRGKRPRDEDDFNILAAATYLQMYRRATRAIYGALVGIVALSVVVGGTIIANVMLMVVAQRTREIGIRRAVGARRVEVLLQFLVESATLSLAGGLAGFALGVLATRAASAASGLRFPVEAWTVAAGLGLVLVVGALAGLYPAARAARMDPVAALRYER
jgi:putative ABC transport system permease protein